MNSNQPLTRDTSTSEVLLPIREVALRTGVNAVTLRAWERRYGLIRPLRTLKGHRLYSVDQIARIHDVLGWLQRGVAVSQVKLLLQEAQQPEETLDSFWTGGLQQWLGYIEELAERPLDESFNQALALYPPETLCRYLLLPLLERLELRWNCQSATGVEQVFFLSWLRNKLGSRIAHDNRLRSGAPLLMLNLSDRVMEPGFWLSAWLANNSDCPLSLYEWPIPAENLTFAVAKLKPRAVVLYADGCVKPGYLRAMLEAVDVPLLLSGHAVSIHHDMLGSTPDIHLADNPIATLHRLQQLNLVESFSGASHV
ncbi:MerR family transcriptional regulator [Cellvibrio polysaccharolyticus]|uniref:MerR family transcriptional regulator n=1 Tax=Cellvibrio polysaccharolyticus TaxID=2082724 RepID=A0A928YTR6_9GAMM|nr:MerR family transcriptional regulator [Cellvibrio polysaccharolyticus]MBE8717836.1 MerR family transcriptional regulator [Cellvibrio polysaccharolyticus]